jgi:phosphoribosyl 1,2-cyclic phosphate phosphodiesterase
MLVDTSPELRLQCLACGIRAVDAVLFTHHHMDHIAGLDDLRRFNWLQRSVLHCYAQAVDAEAITRTFSYAFIDDPDYPSHKPNLEFHIIDGPFTVTALPPPAIADSHPAPGSAPRATARVVPIPLQHGPTPVLGFRFDGFAYCTDCNHIPDRSLALLKELDVLVLDALRYKPHPTHFNVEQAVNWARRIGAKQTYFTHIAHELLHERLNRELPDGMALGFDGQVIEV